MPESQAVRIARDLHMVSTLTRRLLEGGVADGHGEASFTQIVVLKWLDAATPRRAQHVARFLSASAPAASQLLSRLKLKGLLRSRPDPRDGRAEQLFLTPRGRALVDRHEREKTNRLEGMLSGLSAEHRRRIAEGLESAIELLLRGEPELLDMCLHCGAHASPHCVMRRHGLRCPTEAEATTAGHARVEPPA